MHSNFISAPEGNVIDLVSGTPLKLTAGIELLPGKLHAASENCGPLR